MSDYVLVGGYSPRALAEAIARAAVMTADDLRGMSPDVRLARAADEVLDVMLQRGVKFASIKPEKRS